MLGSLAEADDAVQDAWLRVSRAGTNDVANVGGWLTTIVARICLNMLRTRNVRREERLEVHLPDPVIGPVGELGPEGEARLAESVGLALLVVLDALTPAERLAFVLHDMFDVPFEEIAPVVDRSPAAARQLASRARRRVQAAEVPDSDLDRQRTVVDAFFLAARRGDFDVLVAVLHPDVVLRADFGPSRSAASVIVRGASAAGSAGAARCHSGGGAPACADQRCRWRRHHARWPAARRDGFHCGQRADRRARHTRRFRPHPQIGIGCPEWPVGPRRRWGTRLSRRACRWRLPGRVRPASGLEAEFDITGTGRTGSIRERRTACCSGGATSDSGGLLGLRSRQMENPRSLQPSTRVRRVSR